MIKAYHILICPLLILTIYGCPVKPTPVPTPTPIIIPTPIIPTPVALPAYSNYKLDFGPGSKGPDVSPDNLSFIINLPDNLVRSDLTGFKIQSVKMDKLVLNLIKDNQTVITATVLPTQGSILFTTGAPLGLYKIEAQLEGSSKLAMSGSLVEVKKDYNSEVKVNLYQKESGDNKDDIDIEILTRNIKR